MILKCDCFNSTADGLYGKGFRPHVALVKFRDRPGSGRRVEEAMNEEYSCCYCYYPRSAAKGLVTGVKM